MSNSADRLRANNFDLIRLTLAAIVAMVHVAVLSQEPGLRWIPRALSSAFAVKAFFVVSGFLIVLSFERSTTWREYAEKRLRRLIPGYAVVVVSCAVGLWLVSDRPASEYFGPAWWRYLVSNLAFLNFLAPTLPGVFVGNAVDTVNGALWTLKIEVLFYATVPFLVWLCRRAGWRRTLPVVYAASVGYVAVLGALSVSESRPVYDALARQLPGQLSYFVSGAALYYGLEWVSPRTVPVAAVSALVLITDLWHPLGWAEPAAIAGIVGAAAFASPVLPVGRFGDFSYGLYILHFPVIQVVIQTGRFAGQPGLLFVAALLPSCLGAILLWHLVEKRWLLASSHYRRASGISRPGGSVRAAG